MQKRLLSLILISLLAQLIKIAINDKSKTVENFCFKYKVILTVIFYVLKLKDIYEIGKDH